VEVTRPLPDFSWATQSPIATSPSVIVRQPSRTSPGPWPPAASHVFGPLTTQVDPETPHRTTPGNLHREDPTSLHWFHTELYDPAVQSQVRDVSQSIVRPIVGISPSAMAAIM